MNDSVNQALLAVNSTEWLNLCARGSIRMGKRRPVVVSNPPSKKELEKVFAAAPFTKLSSSVDLFILAIDRDWTKTSAKHQAFPSEILTLSLSDVLSHRPISQSHYDYYSKKVASCGVFLEDAKFESDWEQWIIKENIQSSLTAASLLQHSFDLKLHTDIKRDDKYKWEDIAKLTIRPKGQIKTKPGHLEALLRYQRVISDAVAATYDTEQYFIACLIEWIEVRLRKDPMKKKPLNDILSIALANAKEIPFAAPGEQTVTAMKSLLESYPQAFTEELTPATVIQVVRMVSDARSRKLNPESVIKTIHSFEKSSSSASLIAFLIATSLGIELTNQLVHASSHMEIMDIDWEVANS
jgi:hypothetical protein